MDSNPIHIVATGRSPAERAEALRAFHHGLDKADENLRRLLPRKDPAMTSVQPTPGFVVTDESQSFASAQKDGAASRSPLSLPLAPFTLTPPWYTDAQAGVADSAASQA
jgi:hypothetical protein